MAIAPDRGLEVFERAFREEEDHRLGKNRQPVEINPQDKDLLPIFHQMKLDINLVSPTRSRKRIDPREIAMNALTIVGTVHFVHGGNLEFVLREAPHFIPNLLK